MKQLKVLASVLFLGLPAITYGQGPNPDEVYINQITYGGTGCPAGSVAGNIAEDARAFTLLFDQYTAEAGPGILLVAGRKACQVTLDLHIPGGWQYTLFTVDTRGFLNLESGTSATQQNRYYFQGGLNGPALVSNFYGPRVGDYMARDNVGITSLVWSPCGVNRALNVNTSVRVAAPWGRRALATVDSLDGEFKLRYWVQWRRCR